MTRLEAMAAYGRTQRLLSDAMWAVGELATAVGVPPHDWSLEDLAQALGLPLAVVQDAQRVHDRFVTISSEPQFELLFEHYRRVQHLPTYGEATQALEWAKRNQANPAELSVYLRLQGSEPDHPEQP